jgi:hypothetical protein
MTRDDAELMCRAVIPILCQHIAEQIARSMQPIVERISKLEEGARVRAMQTYDRPPQVH